MNESEKMEKLKKWGMSERVDVLDENGNETGKTATLLEVHRDGLWHQSAHVWVWDGEGKILLQKRAMVKPTWPGWWDISAAGHITAGEEIEDGALREAEEELGVKFEKEKLEKVGRVMTNRQVPETEWWEREWNWVWVVEWKGEIEELKMQEEEVEELKWVPLEEFWEMTKDPEKARLVPQNEFELLRNFLTKNE